MYQLLLKNKAIYSFNRFYLAGGVLFSLLVPLITIHYSAAHPSAQPVQALFLGDNISIPQQAGLRHLSPRIPVNYTLFICLGVYSLITALLLFRFVKNLWAIRSTIVKYQKVNYKGAVLVLIERDIIPHTFLNYIFLNKGEYQANRLSADILRHEMTHALQLHSVDVVWMQLVQAVFWFNPMLFLYRGAIQLNHEFIADAGVVNLGNLVRYQRLLLNKAGQSKSFSITSQFNHSITKRRLIMMTKTTSAASAWISRLAVIPVMLAAFMLFCTKAGAQDPVATKKAGAANPSEPAVTMQMKLNPKVTFTKWEYPFTKEGVSQTQLNEYRSIEDKYVNEQPKPLGKFKKIPKSDQDRLEKLYKQMSAEQQQQQTVGFMYGPPPLPTISPSQAQLAEWKASKRYGVWINGKRVENARLSDYKPGNFRQVLISRLTIKAINNDGFHTQVDLMTADYYNTYRREVLANRYISRMYIHYSKPKVRKG